MSSGVAGTYLPDGGEELLGLVVAGKTVNAGLDKNEAELGVGVLAELVKVLVDGHSLLDEVVEILRELGSETGGLEDTNDLGASDGLDLGDTVRVTENQADLGREVTLASVLEDLLLDGGGLSLAPRRGSAAVRKGRAGNTLAVKWLQREEDDASEGCEGSASYVIEPRLRSGGEKSAQERKKKGKYEEIEHDISLNTGK